MHVGTQRESRELGGRHGVDEQVRGRVAEGGGQALAGDGGGALADHDDTAQRAVSQSGPDRLGKGFGTEVDGEPAVGAGCDPAPEGLAERGGGF